MRANDVLPIMFSIIKRVGAAMNTRTPASHAKTTLQLFKSIFKDAGGIAEFQ
ncbi:MAG: hypothetical protein ICV55_07585 [Coleofasciculus sp. C3-bin4]|nr:hypothetical protein [Coleofasciculus sp. C3-bin4]